MILSPFDVIRPEGRAKVTLEVFEEGGERICGIVMVTGRLKCRPREWLAAMRFELAKIERIAKASGCVEMRVGGRDWSRVLTDYQPFGGIENGLRKRL